MAMEGNGPFNGTARTLGKIVLADDPVAGDATCARLMGFHPERVSHIREAGECFSCSYRSGWGGLSLDQQLFGFPRSNRLAVLGRYN